ncbi:MAG: RND family efflux transporter MFP subunit [Kiritimatiellia bacterium]|jgi:RND family efflux transporter MFP subunit
MTLTRKLVNLLVAPLVLAAAFFMAQKMVKSKKSPPIKTPVVVAARVVVFDAAPTTVKPTIHTYGNTRSHLTTSLASQVGGEILRLAPGFEAGGLVSKGDVLVEINPVDLRSVLSDRISALAIAQQAFAEEQTRSQLAEEDWIASGRKVEDASDYTLRKPQLLAAEARVDAAEGGVSKAELDVERSTVRAPFDAIVESRSASPGNVVMAGASLGQLLSREKIEVRLPLTPQQVSRMNLSDIASKPLLATLTTPTLPGKTWTARIGRIEPAVDPRNQTLWMIGEIDDPFSDPDAFLPVGAFVNASLLAEPLETVYVFPEVSVVDDDFIWVVSPSNTLSRQRVEMVFTQDASILARIPTPAFALPLKVASRPLASFRQDQVVAPEGSDEN